MDQKIIQLLEDIKKLVILKLVKGEVSVSTDEIGSVLGVTGRSIRNIATSKKSKNSK